MFRQRQRKQGRQITGISATGKQTRHVAVHSCCKQRPRLGARGRARVRMEKRRLHLVGGRRGLPGDGRCLVLTGRLQMAAVFGTRQNRGRGVASRIHMQNIRSAQRSQRDEPVNKGTK